MRFQRGAPGIAVGGSVLFDGVRVGEVTDIRFDSADPDQVLATIAIYRKTPVRVDTRVGVDIQGLTGGGGVSLHGGGAPPMLTADPGLVAGLTESARQVLRRLDKALSDNADSLRTTLSNVQLFSDAPARNSGRLDGIVQGLERMTRAGPAKPPTPAYDLAAPASFPSMKSLAGQLAVVEPTAVIM